MRRAALFFYLAFVFVQLGVYQLWRAEPSWSGAPAWPAFLILSIALSGIAWGLLRLAPEDAVDERPRWQRGDWLYASVVLAVGLAMWAVFVRPDLQRTIDTWGDEDFHFSMVQFVANYMARYLRGDIPAEMLPRGYRYPDLLPTIDALLANEAWGTTGAPWAYRISLGVWSVATAGVGYWAARRLIGDRRVSLALALLLATSPLLLCYATERYLDIAHPLFAILLFVELYALIASPTSTAAYSVIAAAGFLSFVRDNTAPTTLLTVLVAAGYVFWHRAPGWRRWAHAALMVLAGVAPLLAYYRFKSLSTSVDAGRVALRHLSAQNYSDFFMMFPYYVPFVFVVLAFFAPTGDNKRRIAAASCFVSLGAQLFAYAVFQPGWMPWSRNYLMFYGQVVACGLIGAQALLTTWPRFRPAVLLLCVAGTTWNVWASSRELGRNVVFHEAVLRYDYPRLFEALAGGVLPAGATLYMNYPSDDTAWAMAAGLHPIGDVKVEKIKFDPKTSGYSLRDFMTFAELRERLPQEAEYVLFHWHEPTTRVPILANWKNAPRPTSTELADFEILGEFVDPISTGHNGMVLLRHRRT